MPTTFNTTDPKPGYVYDTATDTWFPLLGIAPGSSIVRWRFTAVGAETSVSGLDDLSATLSYNAGTEQVYLNGVLLVRTADYTATTGTSVTGLTALAASDVIEVISFNATNVQITDALLETDINAKGDLIVGAAIDTAAILTSGTNGQVLSVNTATATGLAWITSDDANAIQNAIVDAKGDLIVGTAADTVGRLAVGTNGYFLSADSSAGTGLAWAAASAGATYAVFQDVKSSGGGGNFTSGAFRTRDLQTSQFNNITGCSLASNQITLAAGTYIINAVAPAESVDQHQTRFQNITDSTTAVLGGNAYAAPGATGLSTYSVCDGGFTIASSKVFELQHRATTTRNGTGFGVNNGFGVGETYAIITIAKVA